MDVILRGERTTLRGWTEDDLDFVLSVTSDPLIPSISGVPHEPDPAGARAFIAEQRQRHDHGAGWAWAVCADDGRVIGYVGALWIARPAGRASIGYWARDVERGSGL